MNVRLWGRRIILVAVLTAAPAPLWASGGDEITLRMVKDMHYGKVVPGPAGGQVVIGPTGTITVSGGAISLGGTITAAKFEIEGKKNRDFEITLPVRERLRKGGTTVWLRNFTSSPSLFGRFDKFGKATIYLGATLFLDAGQPPGHYEGDISITVRYVDDDDDDDHDDDD